jgi:predicted Na+-dependent transporter
LGLLFAVLFKQRIEDVIAIAVETGVQSMPIAVAVLKVRF